jgi:hypothetical protein
LIVAVDTSSFQWFLAGFVGPDTEAVLRTVTLL